jgi:hypothetical protein
MNEPVPSNPKAEPPIELARRAFRRRFLLDANRHDREQMSWVYGYSDCLADHPAPELPNVHLSSGGADPDAKIYSKRDTEFLIAVALAAAKQPDETPVLYTKADAEALCAIAVAGVRRAAGLDAARYRWLKAHWYDAPLIGHTDAADLDAIIDGQFAEEAIDSESPATTGEQK